MFGVPGDYVLGFYDLVEKSPIRMVGTTREDAAGLAADAYARTKLTPGVARWMKRIIGWQR